MLNVANNFFPMNAKTFYILKENVKGRQVEFVIEENFVTERQNAET